MSDIFNRRCRRSPTVAIRAYVVGLAAVLLASLAWHGLRAYVVRAFASSSVGCEARTGLIAAAIDGLYPRQRVRVFGGKPMLSSFRQGDQGGVSWLMDWERLRPVQAAVADRDLDYCGRLRAQAMAWYAQVLPADWDQDGSIEVMPFAIAAAELGCFSVYWAVIRLGGEANELVGLVAIGSSTVRGAIQATPGWPDEDEDGTFEWVFATMPRPSADGTSSCAEAIAIFEWSEPGGVLRPRVVPDDGSMLVWTPPSGRPHRFPADRLVNEVCQELLPVPEGFGATPASQPASAPTSSPAP